MQRALLVLLVCASYLLFAGGPEWTAIPLLLLAAVAALAAPRRTLTFPPSDRPLDWSLIVVMVGLLLQLVPLPRAIVTWVSPRSSAVQETLNFVPLGNLPTWLTLSIAPGSTLDALGTFALAVLTFWAARAVFSGQGGTRRVCQALAVIGGLAALVAIVQRAVVPGLVLGILRPGTPSASPFGAFVNRNHFAAWLIMLAGPVAGYLMAHLNVHHQYHRGWAAALREALRTGSLLTVIAALMSTGTIFLTLSRSALAGVGAAAVGWWWFVRRRSGLRRHTSPMVFAAAGCAVLMLVVFVDADKWAARISSSFDRTAVAGGRLTIWSETMPIIRDFPVTGTGAGTFSDAMTVYQETRVWVGSMGKWTHFNSAHSHYLQLVTEGGLLLLLPAAVGFWWLMVCGRRALAADHSQIFWMRAGAAAGLLGIAVQSVWEVPLVMPANAVMAAVLAALVVHDRPDHASDTARLANEDR